MEDLCDAEVRLVQCVNSIREHNARCADERRRMQETKSINLTTQLLSKYEGPEDKGQAHAVD